MSYIVYLVDGINILTMEVNENSKFYELSFKYSNMKGKSCEEFSFEYNSKEIKRDSGKTLKELGIPNEAQIKVISSEKKPNNIPNLNNLNNVKYFNVSFNYAGNRYQIQADSKMKFSELVTKFYSKAQINEKISLTFIFNSVRIFENESKTLEELKIYDQSNIEAILIQSIFGAI